jgi:hypothetical protein
MTATFCERRRLASTSENRLIGRSAQSVEDACVRPNWFDVRGCKCFAVECFQVSIHLKARQVVFCRQDKGSARSLSNANEMLGMPCLTLPHP